MSDEMSGARIAWFTPLSVQSAIGEFSVHVTAELAKFADVEIWTSDEPPYHDTNLPVVGYGGDSEDLDVLAHREVIIYNMGDYLPFHGHMHSVARRYPGIVILHDRVLHHLYAGMWLTQAERLPDVYVERMRSYYGTVGENAARESLEGERSPVWESDEEALRYPLYEEAIVNALGVVTHSARQAADIRQKWWGPVHSLKLPCYAESLRRVHGTFTMPSDGRIRVVTVGHVNPNKQVHRVVGLLAADEELARSIHYTIVGPDDGFVDYVSDLRRMVDDNSDRVSVEILGWLPPDRLEALMEQADLFVNLRYPAMEGSSASLMQQLTYARPVLCFDAGFFGEMPEEALARVPTGDFRQVAATLKELVSDPERRRRIGERGREVAAACSESSYVEGLLGLVDRSRHATPALSFVDSVARELGHMRVDKRLSIFDEIASDFGRVLSL
jgi:glycosyltransferase involved in cell wall biosynthesis